MLLEPRMAPTIFKAIHAINGVTMVAEGKGWQRKKLPSAECSRAHTVRGILSACKPTAEYHRGQVPELQEMTHMKEL